MKVDLSACIRHERVCFFEVVYEFMEVRQRAPAAGKVGAEFALEGGYVMRVRVHFGMDERCYFLVGLVNHVDASPRSWHWLKVMTWLVRWVQ